jgi:hypothetical protein
MTKLTDADLTPDQLLLVNALDGFKDATALLSQAWEKCDPDAITNYPSYLPSFDEFAHAVVDMEFKLPPNPIVAVGTRVVCTFVDDRGGCFSVNPGEFGEVTECRDELLRIRLDRYHPGADEWHNEAVITGDDGIDLASCEASSRTQIQRYFEEHYAVIHPIPTRSN